MRWIKRLELPCAVFAANDKTAESVLVAALAAGLQVPDDLAVLGVGYVSQNQLERLFKRTCGMTTSEYRRTAKSGGHFHVTA